MRLGAVLLALALLAGRATAVKELSEWHEGILTHYGGKQDKMDPEDPSYGSKEGSCGYGAIPKDRWPYFSVAALATSNTFFKNEPSNGCGQCFQIQCVSGMGDRWKDACYKDSRGAPKSILVVITDSCPECVDNHLDVQALSFAKLTNPDLGRINIKYRRIECTPPDDMKVSVMDFVGSNRWLRLSIDDTGGRGSVTQVYAKSSGTTDWIPMKNTWGAAWELSKAPNPPLDFKMVTDDGEEVIATGVIKQNGGIKQGAFQERVKFGTGVQFTITDPAAGLVQAASGPDDGFDPMVATSDTPGNGNDLDVGAEVSATPGPAAERKAASSRPLPSSAPKNATAPTCVDVPAPGEFSCAQQKDFGKCQSEFMVKGGYCALTCGRCSAPSLSAALSQAASAQPSPQLPAPAIPSTEPVAKPAASAPAASGPAPGNATALPAPAKEAAVNVTAAPGALQPASAALGPAHENGTALPVPAKVAAANITPAPRAPPLAPANATAAAPAPEAVNVPACSDVPAPDGHSCKDQKAWGKCDKPYLKDFCAATCGRCAPQPSSGPAKPTAAPPAQPPAVESFAEMEPPAPASAPSNLTKTGPAGAAPTQEGALPNASAAPVPEADPCHDVVPPGAYSCAEQKAWGKCSTAYMKGFCNATCGRCTPQPDPAGPAAPAAGAPKGKGRRLLGWLSRY